MAGKAGKFESVRDVLSNLGALALIVALVALGFAYGIDAMLRGKHVSEGVDDTSIVLANIAGVALELPAKALRKSGASGAAFLDRLELGIERDLGGNEPTPIDLTLVPKARARASAALLDSVYLQHFSDEELRSIPGLVGKPLTGGNGYDGETVWYDPIRINPFVAKCVPPVAEEGSGICVRTVLLDSGLSAILAFEEPALKYWRQFDTSLAAFLDEIGAGAPMR